MNVNPDIEQLSAPVMTPSARIMDFENAVSEYGLARAAVRRAGLDVSAAGTPVPEHLSERLRLAVIAEDNARHIIAAKAQILTASGLLDRAADALANQGTF